jgi:hypothetical protein
MTTARFVSLPLVPRDEPKRLRRALDWQIIVAAALFDLGLYAALAWTFFGRAY